MRRFRLYKPILDLDIKLLLIRMGSSDKKFLVELGTTLNESNLDNGSRLTDLRSELKLLLGEPDQYFSDSENNYIAPQIFFNWGRGFNFDQDNADGAIGFNLKYGQQTVYSSGLFLEYYGGLGLQNKFGVSSQNTIGDAEEEEGSSEVGSTVTLGARVGVSF